ncbi:MAG: hypothetical protein A3F11_00830 [Gammaproteobacteria bacterium RIFCSPHIGHO2_12_FULL_37_14]|nr:MAG: hypothetical protein A3F11_00830 [Gammaproteobacteria bacterium RIFCSPHIGHO2_12_FULL_37_14]
MSATRKILGAIGGCLGVSTAYGAVMSATNAATGALSGVIGAKVLDAAGHAGFNALEATQTTAVGGAIIGGALGVAAGSCLGINLVLGGGANKKEKEKSASCAKLIGSAVIYAAMQSLYAVIGRAVLINNGTDVEMSNAQVAASAAVGGAISCIPAAIALLCCSAALAVGIASCAMAMAKDDMVSIRSANPPGTRLPSPFFKSSGGHTVLPEASLDIEGLRREFIVSPA